jgi:hypothetical protein
MYLVSGCVRELRRSNELHQQIKCLEAQGRQQTTRTVHALLRSFWISRYLLLPQRKAESVSVLHTSVLYEIRNFRETSWILRSKNNSLRTLYQVAYVCYGGLTELLPLNIWLLYAGCGSLRGKSALSSFLWSWILSVVSNFIQIHISSSMRVWIHGIYMLNICPCPNIGWSK